jgi:hypothetical protein
MPRPADREAGANSFVYGNSDKTSIRGEIVMIDRKREAVVNCARQMPHANSNWD